MSWLKLDLRSRDHFSNEAAEVRDQRRALRERLLGEADLSGAAALEIARELRTLEPLSPAGSTITVLVMI